LFDFFGLLKKHSNVEPSVPPQATPGDRYAIAIIAYNNLEYFRAVLESVLKQKFGREGFDTVVEAAKKIVELNKAGTLDNGLKK